MQLKLNLNSIVKKSHSFSGDIISFPFYHFWKILTLLQQGMEIPGGSAGFLNGPFFFFGKEFALQSTRRR